MKNINLIIVLIFTVFFTSYIKAQNPYYDAIELSKHVDANGDIQSIDQTYSILKNYVSISNPDNTYLDSEFNGGASKNPYIILTGRVQNTRQIFNKDGFITKSIGGLNVTNIADGLAKFLVQRTKQELSIAFFEQFEDKLKTVPELKTLFPNTTRTFTIIDSFKFSVYLNSLQQSFLKDLENLNTNILQLENLGAPYRPFFRSNTGLLTITGLRLIEDFKRGSNPVDIISTIAQDPSFNSLPNANYQNLKNAVKLTDLVSKSFLSTDQNKTWVSANDIFKMISDPTTFQIYLGLIYQLNEVSPIVFKTNTSVVSFKTILQGWATTKQPIENYIKKIVQDYDNINNAISNIRSIKKAGNKPNHSDYYTFYSSVLSLMKTSSNIQSLSGDNTQKPEIDAFLKIAEDAGNIYHDLASQNYSAAIIDIIAFLENTGLVNNQSVIDDFLKYGSFVATVAEAENSDQVQAAIEAVALPIGSATIKKRSSFNIALNAYVGISPALEYNGDTQDNKFSLGVNAPIGIASSWGSSKGNSSLTLFVPLIDLGAVTSFRFGDDQTEELPDIKLENIFSPGLYLVHGWAKLPISWGIGGQLGPQLRKITATDIELHSKTSFSLRAFIAVDIPLLNFYTKSR